MEEGIAEAAHKVFAGGIDTVAALKATLAPLTPPDTTFSAAFKTTTVSNRKLARYYLKVLEMAAKNEAKPWHIPNDDKGTINREHVLPENPGQEWPQFSDELVKLYYKRIDNLVLMRASDNSDLKSAGFHVKSPIYARSPYVLTKQISEASTWGTDEIMARQKTLSNYAIKAWPIQ